MVMRPNEVLMFSVETEDYPTHQRGPRQRKSSCPVSSKKDLKLPFLFFPRKHLPVVCLNTNRNALIHYLHWLREALPLQCRTKHRMVVDQDLPCALKSFKI